MMDIKIRVTILLILAFQFIALGQVNFRIGWEKENPIDATSSISFEEKINVHQEFLEKASEEGDQLKELYGYLYLVYDYFGVQDYSQATKYLLEAESIAHQTDNLGWLGWVTHRKAIVALRLNETEEANEEYKRAATICGQAGDSLCLAESLEQVSLTYGKLGDFENARYYHLKAMPLIKKFGGEAQLGAALNNYGNVYSWQGQMAEAIPYIERSIAIYQKLGKLKEQTKAMNNLAHNFRILGQYDRAQEIIEQCIKINQENNFMESLRTNYANMSVLFDSIGNRQGMKEYLDEYYNLNDSLIGAETQRKIAELEIKYEVKEKELELEKSESDLKASKRKVEQRTAVVFFILLLAGIGLWRWRLQTWYTKKELERNQQNLKELTQILIDKNNKLARLDEKVKQAVLENTNNAIPENFEENIFNQNILTEADWASFKIYFERVHPGYLQNLRTQYPTLTDAEERLFLFIKLQLKTKEAAAILGISNDSVKKARNRLRKKLALTKDIGLEDFINQF